MNSNTECLVCGGTDPEDIFSGLLKRCLDCRFVTASLVPEDDELRNLYSEEYFTGKEYMDYPADRKIFRKNFNKRLDAVIRTVGQGNIRSALEIGCAYGFFGELLSERIPEAEYLGIDVSEKAVQYAAGELKLNVLRTDYLALEKQALYTDVFMWDVIEHLARPDLFLKKIRDELQPDGRLYLTTGDIGALVPRIMKRKWRQIHPPTHLHYFSSRTLTLLLEKKGFRVTRISYPAVSRGVRQIFFSRCMLGKKPGKLVRKIHGKIPAGLSIPLNTWDIMFVMAERR